MSTLGMLGRASKKIYTESLMLGEMEDDCMYDSIKLLLLNALNIDVANYNGVQVARRIMENRVCMEYIVKKNSMEHHE